MKINRVWMIRALTVAGVVLLLALGAAGFRRWRTRPGPGRMIDEARRMNRTTIAPPREDYFHGMDGGLDLALDEIEGRNTWMVWSAGNDRLWNWLAQESGGTFDLLKLVSSYDPANDPKLDTARRAQLQKIYDFGRDNRREVLGVTNEPCFTQAKDADPRRYGLWLDDRQLECPPDPFASEEKYPGVAVGARGRAIPLGSVYGAPTGIVGLRLFPNPEFHDEAVVKWDPVRYYNDPSYYLSSTLVRPYRVGVTCAFCHAGPNPAKPPENLAGLTWDNLSSTIGAHKLRMDRIAMWSGDAGQFSFQLFHSSRPGTADLSLLATDRVHNPRAIPAIFQIAARMQMARAWGKETLAGPSLKTRQISSYVAGGPLAAFFDEPATVWTPRLGIAAMDSAGILSGINRMYAEMGIFSEEMLLHFDPLVGSKPDVPVDLDVMRKNSEYWTQTEALSANVVRFLMRIEAAPGPHDSANPRGKLVFAERCAACHSSKFPPPPAGADPGACTAAWPECWDRYSQWTQTPAFRQQMATIAAAPDFLKNNALTNDLRVPLPAVGTNACVSLGSSGNLWEAFTSQTYKSLSSAGTLKFPDPLTGAERELKLPDGGRGYLRPPSLAGLSLTAPYLHNNSVASLEELLWPEKREKDAIDRTSAESKLRIHEIEITVPAGTPVSLLANLDMQSPRSLDLLRNVAKDGVKAHEKELLELSTCPDFVVNRGHLFGADLTDAEKKDLIDFLRSL